jgi:methylase of polypeptide subunit release factors
MASVKMGYYPTDLDHVKHLARGIEFSEGMTVNALDPCCGCGLALRSLADGQDCGTYGIELDGHRAEEALTRLNRVGFGSYFKSRISNEAFHLMLLNPPYLSVMTEKGNNTRNEKRFLIDSLTHLMYGGLMIYIIPYYRLSADICRVLCDNFDDITVWRFSGEEFKRYRQVAIMGIRRKRQDGSGLVSGLASLALTPHDLPELSEITENRYQLPTKTKKVDLFKGAEFNVAELAEQLNKSTSFSRLFEKNKLDSAAKRPLLPLNLGQVGLIGGSGLINGLVECDTPHIIKGRIVKQNNISKEENLNRKGELMSTTLYKTRSNKMIFNLLTPNGFMSLTDYTTDGGSDDDTDGNDYVNYAKTSASVVPAVTPDALFQMGRTVVTANANESLSDADIRNALALHQSGKWGNIGFNDYRANNHALKNGSRILSAYVSGGGEKFWVLTEADRSATTVLMPDEY